MILVLLLLGPILFLAISAYAYARKAAQNAQDAQRMALIASNLEGQLKQSEARGEQLADIAKHAIDEAAKVAGLKPDEVWKRPDGLPDDYGTREGIGSIQCSCGYTAVRMTGGEYAQCPKCGKPNNSYIAQIVAFCSACNVSVRRNPSEYPIHCPACQTLIDPVLDNPPEL